MADRHREPERDPGKPAAAAKKLYGFLSRVEVLSAVTIIPLCASFLLGTALHRNLFYVLALPVYVVHLKNFDWRCVKDSAIAKVALVYIAYFLLSGLWSDGLSWGGFADLLRSSLLLVLFFLMTLRLGTLDSGFPDRFAISYAMTAGVTLLAVFAATGFGLLPFGPRFGGFGIVGHPIIGSTLYGFALLLCTFVLLPRAVGWRHRIAWMAVIVLCAAFMLLSSSRGPLIALAAALAAGFVLAGRRLTLAIALLTLLGIAAGELAGVAPIELIFERGPSGHFEIWQQALAAIAEHPWLGYGSLVDITFESAYGPIRSPHNLLIANQFYGGLPATAMLLGLLALAFRQAWRALRRGEPVYLALLIFGLVASLFDSRTLVQNLGREWITLWLPICLLAVQEVLQRRQTVS